MNESKTPLTTEEQVATWHAELSSHDFDDVMDDGEGNIVNAKEELSNRICEKAPALLAALAAHRAALRDAESSVKEIAELIPANPKLPLVWQIKERTDAALARIQSILKTPQPEPK